MFLSLKEMTKRKKITQHRHNNKLRVADDRLRDSISRAMEEEWHLPRPLEPIVVRQFVSKDNEDRAFFQVKYLRSPIHAELLNDLQLIGWSLKWEKGMLFLTPQPVAES